MPVFIEQEGKLHGKREGAERKLRRKRSARLVVGKLPFAQPREQRVEVKPLAPFRKRERPHELFESKLSADAAVLQVRLPFLQPKLQDAEVGAERDGIGRHIADIEIDGALQGRAVERQRKIEDDGAREHAPERFTEASDRRRNVLFGAAHLAARILFEIIFVGRALCALRAVFILRRESGGTVDGDAHRRLVRLFHHAFKHLPLVVEGVSDADGRKFGERREPARKDHLIGIMRRRFVPRGIEIVRLRIGAVLIFDDFIGGKQRLLVDDIDGKLRRGKAVLRDEVLEIHMGIRFTRLPLGREHLLVGGSVVGGTQAPHHFVARIAELPRRFDHRARRDIRHDEHAVRILLEGAHRLLHDGSVRRAVHLGIPRLLRLEGGVHVGDVFERRVHIGRRTVLGHGGRDGDKALVHDIGSRLFEELRHEDARPHRKRRRDRHRSRSFENFLSRPNGDIFCGLFGRRTQFFFHVPHLASYDACHKMI